MTIFYDKIDKNTGKIIDHMEIKNATSCVNGTAIFSYTDMTGEHYIEEKADNELVYTSCFQD